MMLKGINKRVIIIKNPNSEIFEEAYFIVKTGKGLFKTPKQNDMVAEANRIITEYHKQQRKQSHPDPTQPPLSGDTANIQKAQKKENSPDSLYYDEFLTDISSVPLPPPAPSLKQDIKSAISFLSSKKVTPKLNISPKSFLYGIGFMSAVVIIFKIVESLL